VTTTVNDAASKFSAVTDIISDIKGQLGRRRQLLELEESWDDTAHRAHDTEAARAPHDEPRAGRAHAAAHAEADEAYNAVHAEHARVVAASHAEAGHRYTLTSL
jgi:hypothetical protein